MTQTLNRSLCATAAISAVLALGSTPALAQEAAPTIQVPPPAAAPAPVAVAPAPAPAAPAIVLPDVSTTAASTANDTVSTPSAEPRTVETTRSAASTPRGRAQTARVERTGASEAPRAEAAPRVASATPAEPPRASSANILNDNPTRPVAAQNPSAQAAQAAPAAVARAGSSDDGLPGEAIAGVLAVLGIGAAGFIALRSRRRRVETDDEVMAAAQPEAEAIREDVLSKTTPVFGTPQPVLSDVRYGFAPARGHVGDTTVIEREPMVMAPVAPRPERPRDTLAMPTAAPRNAEEHSALLDRMVDAEPDDANPFTSRKARRKRARLQLQNIENQARRDTPFDWRTYRPETERSTPASPELVTA